VWCLRVKGFLDPDQETSAPDGVVFFLISAVVGGVAVVPAGMDGCPQECDKCVCPDFARVGFLVKFEGCPHRIPSSGIFTHAACGEFSVYPKTFSIENDPFILFRKYL
jgi:hypothetical protein